MNKDEKCEGREVFSQYFCSGSSCKCCVPQEVCPSCEDKAGDQCSFDILDTKFEGVCQDYCKEGEVRLGDCGQNCGCCVPLDIPNGSCSNELGKVCGGSPFGIPYSGTCRNTCNGDEIRMGPCGIADTDILGRSIESVSKPRQGGQAAASRVYDEDDDCGCCVRVEFPGK